MTGAAAETPSLVASLKGYIDGLPEEERADALHQVFYGFYTRIAIIDRTTYELAAFARDEIAEVDDLPESMGEALRDNGLFVGQELFASRVRTMAAMGHIAKTLTDLLDGAEPDQPFTLKRAVAFDQESGRLRTYDLAKPGEHPDLPYDPRTYDPNEM